MLLHVAIPGEKKPSSKDNPETMLILNLHHLYHQDLLTGRQKDKRTDRQTYRQTDRQTTHQETGTSTDKTDKQIDKTDRQTGAPPKPIETNMTTSSSKNELDCIVSSIDNCNFVPNYKPIR